MGALGALLAVVLVSFIPRAAHACGGFFCQSTPVVQSGEQIVYSVEDDGTLTMTVLINYTGTAPEFAWILPVPETPTITLGAAALFDQLDAATRPSFGIRSYRTEGTCRREPDCEFPPAPDAGVWWAGPQDALAFAPDAGAGGPTIFSMGTLGPYETVVIGGASATEIHEWLDANGYDIPASAIPLLDHYVAGGQRFVALRLRNDASVSEIQPISLGFGALPPCLPIRLTAIATAPDLPITAYFLARTRATPRNYSLIEAPFPRQLFTYEITYTSWVSNTADDMGGQAFIADYAGDTPPVALTLADVADLATSATPQEFLYGLQSRGYMGDGQLLALLTRFIVPPDEADPRSYYNCLVSFGGSGCGDPSIFDPAGLAAAIEETIRQPRERAQAMVEGAAYTTRLFTTMSAEEMTVDPEFVLDDGLGEVTNLHYAEVVTECDADHYVEDAAQRILLPDGRVERLREARPSPSDAARCVSRGGSLRGIDAAVPDASLDAAIDAGPVSIGGGGGCSASGGWSRVPSPAPWAFFGLGLAALTVRRRARARG